MECDGNNCSAKMKRSFDGGSTWDNERIIATFNKVERIYSYANMYVKLATFHI